MRSFDFYKTGKIEDYLSMKEDPSYKEKSKNGRTHKGKRDNNKTGVLRGL